MRSFASWWERIHARHIASLALALAVTAGAPHLAHLGTLFARPDGFIWS
jgi:hypothetical protein